jgi:L-alanine-DL-glutamate epimerase-like enolase superfamily enzyme
VSAIRSVSARVLEIPFKVSFAHASATRHATQSLWVEVQDEQGHTGHGEGCPREYVTGEALPDALAFTASMAAEVQARVCDLATLRTLVAEEQAAIDAHPAAWCALELALLDLFGKRSGMSVEELLGLPPLSGAFRYTAVLGDASPQRFASELARYRQAGFRDFKLKLSGDPERDGAKMAALRSAGIPSARVRADANNVWRDAAEAIAALQALPLLPFALEEPLQAGDLDGMARIGERLGCALILDESAARAEELGQLPAGPRWILNLRVSKMGGVLRSLETASRAAQAQIGLVVGAHVGETSVLTRAGLTIAHATRPNLLAQEGAFGTHLLERDVVAQPVVFDAGGWLDADALSRAAGWGLEIVPP